MATQTPLDPVKDHARSRLPDIRSVWGLALGLVAATVCAADRRVPEDYPTIERAVAAAVPGDRVIVAPGRYAVSLALKSGVEMRGRETARVLVEAASTGRPAVAIDSVVDVVLASMTFLDADAAVRVTASDSVTIASNVFTGIADTAVETDFVSDVDVLNNVFFDNDTAIARGSTDTHVRNNIFARNAESVIGGIGVGSIALNVSFNCFFDNASANVAYGTNFQIGDPLFVAPDLPDFHLRQGSACIDVGSGTDTIDNTIADAGAYGGSLADGVPYPVQGVMATDTSSGATAAIDLRWQPNLAYLVTNSVAPGSYRVYYRRNAAGPPFDGTDAGGGTQPSPIEVGSVTSFKLDALQAAAPTSVAPQLESASPRDGAIALTWTPVPNTIGYRVLYGIGAVDESRLEIGATSAHTVSGLANGTVYRFAVEPRLQATYHVAVAALDNTPARHESAFSPPVALSIGPIIEGPRSNEIAAIPSATIPVPDLPDEGGCFIATAAYRSDSAPAVLILRDYRDRYLLPYAVGRALVRAYYRAGPALSRALESAPGLQSVARVALAPFVAAALVIVASSAAAKVLLAVLLAALVLVHARPRGAQLLAVGLVLLAATAANAQPSGAQRITPGWTFEIKAGRFEPELGSFAMFYGGEDTGYYAGNFAYRFKPWLDVGAEAGYVHETGFGVAAGQGVPGAEVEYSLLPLHLFVTLRALFEFDQLLVPYVGVGVTSAYYREEIELQPDRTGWSDFGSFARLGLEVYLNRLDPGHGPGGLGDGVIKQSYIYLEVQRLEAEQTGNELGGDALVLGMRFSFGRPLEQRRRADGTQRSAPRGARRSLHAAQSTDRAWTRLPPNAGP